MNDRDAFLNLVERYPQIKDWVADWKGYPKLSINSVEGTAYGKYLYGLDERIYFDESANIDFDDEISSEMAGFVGGTKTHYFANAISYHFSQLLIKHLEWLEEAYEHYTQ